MYVLKLAAESGPLSSEIHRAASSDELVAIVRKCYAEMIVEEDAQHPDHFDISAWGNGSYDIFTIEPVKGN